MIHLGQAARRGLRLSDARQLVDGEDVFLRRLSTTRRQDKNQQHTQSQGDFRAHDSSFLSFFSVFSKRF
jgi:hypothetical protein